jgi:hypothetical protein
MVHFPEFARARLWIHRAVRRFYPRGFPHSEIPGSMPACGSPRLIAACHVLHRLLLPRHPPCALSSLTIKLTRCTRACARTRRFNFMGLDPCSSRAKCSHASTPQQGTSGTHKNLQPCRLPNLFSCQISSSLRSQLNRLGGFGLFPTQCSTSGSGLFCLPHDAQHWIRGCFGLALLACNNLMRQAEPRFINLVELTGIEPVASWLQTRRSPS